MVLLCNSSSHCTRIKLNVSYQVARIVTFVEYRRFPVIYRQFFFRCERGRRIVYFFADQSKRKILVFSARSCRKEPHDRLHVISAIKPGDHICLLPNALSRERDSSIPLVLETSTLWCIRNIDKLINSKEYITVLYYSRAETYIRAICYNDAYSNVPDRTTESIDCLKRRNELIY